MNVIPDKSVIEGLYRDTLCKGIKDRERESSNMGIIPSSFLFHLLKKPAVMERGTDSHKNASTRVCLRNLQAPFNV